MHLLIVSCTPRAKEKSNTDKILDELRKGYEYNGNTTEIQRKHYIYIKEMNGKVLEKNSMKMIIFCLRYHYM